MTRWQRDQGIELHYKMMAEIRIRIALGFTLFVLLSRANINIVYTSNPLDVKSNYAGGRR